MLNLGSKRRRTTKQIKAEKQAAAEKDRLINEKLAMFDQIQSRIQQLEKEDGTKEAAKHLLSQMIDAGLVKQTENNSILVNGANGQQEFKLNEAN